MPRVSVYLSYQNVEPRFLFLGLRLSVLRRLREQGCFLGLGKEVHESFIIGSFLEFLMMISFIDMVQHTRNSAYRRIELLEFMRCQTQALSLICGYVQRLNEAQEHLGTMESAQKNFLHAHDVPPLPLKT